MARSGLLHVPGDECRQAEGRRALCFDLQPQFRRPPGPRRPHASGQPRNGRGRCRDRSFDGRADALMADPAGAASSLLTGTLVTASISAASAAIAWIAVNFFADPLLE